MLRPSEFWPQHSDRLDGLEHFVRICTVPFGDGDELLLGPMSIKFTCEQT